YWLPLFVPMAAGVIIVLRRIAHESRWLAVMVILTLLSTQAFVILKHPKSGLLARRQTERAAEQRRELVLNLTPPNSLIFASHVDQYLFPDRLVAFSLPKT